MLKFDFLNFKDMQWRGRRQSTNVEDRRGFSGGKIAAGGGLIGIVFLIIQYFMGGDTSQLLNQVQKQISVNRGSETPLTPEEEEMGNFVSVMLADNEDVWNKIFAENGSQYQVPTLVLFRDAVESACGNASASVGPFYCPSDYKVYMDLTFFDELKNRFGAKGGDFAIAYVLDHEVGHHVQNLLGTSDKIHSRQQQLDEKDVNKLSVALELQADFFAGVWAHHDEKMKNVLDEGDIEEALSAASAVGDDHLQKQAQGYVVPDAFTHGTSEQRVYWFKRGFQTGDISKGNTFDEVL